MHEYIILEIIPTATKNGDVIQLSALKIKDLQLLDRFDYRLNEDKIYFNQLKDLINYDKDKFIYKDTTLEIMDNFYKWSENLPLLIIDNNYTLNYLSNFENKKESIFKYLNMEYNDNVINDIILKYNLEPSNYIVDLLYEALIYESNNKK